LDQRTEHTQTSTATTTPSGRRTLGAGGTFRLEPPRLRTTADPREERHATWFELYFDLVFVAAVSQLGMALARNPSAAAYARFAALFVVVVWAWVLYTLYTNRFDTDDLIFRLSKSVAMLAIVVVAVSINHVMAGNGGTRTFAIGYVVIRVLLLGLYGRARRHVSGAGRRLTDIYLVGYSSTTALWLVSIFVPGPARYLLWGVAMVTDLLVPIRAWAALPERTVVISHLTERFGTFFIIVLGESVLAAVVGVADVRFTFDSWVVAGTCFLIALCLWWIYFDLADTSVVGRGALGLVYVYSHFPLFAGVAVLGAGTKLAVIHASHPGLSAGIRWALAGGVGAFALSLATIHLGAEWTSLRDHTFLGRVALAIFALTLAAAGRGIAPPLFAALLAAGVLGQLLLEAFTPRFGSATVYEPPAPAISAGSAEASPLPATQ
jgi:low temperature requirement protein LtrA